MVVVVALAVAGDAPVADVAVGNGVGVGGGSAESVGRSFVRGNRLVESLPHQPVVGHVVLHPVRLGGERLLRVDAGRHDMHSLRQAALDLRKQIAVEAQLQDGAGFRLPRELGVHHFVGPVAKRTLRLDPPQHVRPSRPAPRAKRRLHDHSHAAAHGPLRLRVRAGLETRHVLRKRFDVGRFVRVAAFAQQLHFLLLPLKARRTRNPPVDPIQVQPRQMPAGEEVGQVGGGQPKAVVGELHGAQRKARKQASYTAVRPSTFRQRDPRAIQRRDSGRHRVMVASRCPGNRVPMDAPNVFEIDLRTFQADVIERSRQVPVVVVFWTDQVAPAVETKAVLERLAAQYQGKFVLALSDIAQDQTLAQQLRVQAVPSIRVIKDGQLAEQMEGPQGERALRELIDALTQSPSEALQSQLADYLEAEDYDGALGVLQQAIGAEPNNVGFKVEWADVLLLQGDLAGARTVLATIAEDAPERERPAARLELLDEAAGMGSVATALAEVEQDDSNLEARYRAAVLLAAERRYEDALEQAMAILMQDRKFRDDAGRLTMVRIMSLMPKGSNVAKAYRRRMFNFLH